MKKGIGLVALMTLGTFLFTSCNQDCVFSYYDSSNSLLNTEVFDGDEVSSSQCADYNGEENVTTEVNDQVVTASYVSCTSGW